MRVVARRGPRAAVADGLPGPHVLHRDHFGAQRHRRRAGPSSAPVPLGNGETPYSIRPGRTQSARAAGQASTPALLAMLRAPAGPRSRRRRHRAAAVSSGRGGRRPRPGASRAWARRARARLRRSRSYALANSSSRKPSRFMPESSLIQHGDLRVAAERLEQLELLEAVHHEFEALAWAAAASCSALKTPSSSRMRLREARGAQREALARAARRRSRRPRPAPWPRAPGHGRRHWP